MDVPLTTVQAPSRRLATVIVLTRSSLQRALPLAILGVIATWLMRAALFTSAVPAGTDMLGFVTRASENSVGSAWSSVWAPSVLGSPRPYTLDNVLGLATKITGDPLVTVKVVSVLTLFASGAFAMHLVNRWFEDRPAALFAGVLYMTSQASLSRWASGQLNVEIATALAPLLILLWSRCHERFSPRRAVGLATVSTILMLVRLDMALYVMPFLGIYSFVHLLRARDRRAGIRALMGNVAIAVSTLIALNAYQVLPMLAGVRPPWASAEQLFTLDDLRNHSLDLFHSAIGFAREIGYLGFTGQQTWYSHPYVSTQIYYAAAAVLVALAATTAVRRWRDANIAFLTIAAIVATFIAKGIGPPLGAPYAWAVSTVPFLGNLRNPNRWLIFQAIAYSALGGLALARLLAAIGCRHRLWRVTVRWTVPRFCALLFIVFLPVAPTLFTGFQTWRPQASQVGLMQAIADDDAASVVATVPFDQSVRYITQGTYQGYEHDLGAESSTFTGKPSLSDGGWSRSSADLLAYASTLLERHDPAFQELLGSVGVGELLRFSYPATAPHLLRPQLGDDYQQQAIDSLPGFAPVMSNSSGSVYRLTEAAPLVSLRTNVGVVFGGASGMAALADTPGVDLRDWAVLSADELVAEGGIDALVRAIGSADVVMVANESVQDIAVAMSPGLAEVDGITSITPLDRRTQLIPSDASIRTGSMADATAPVPALAQHATSTITADGPTTAEIWSRIRYAPNASWLTFRLDGRDVADILPLATTDAGFRWVRVATVRYGPGEHALDVEAHPSKFGGAFEVDQTRLVDPDAFIRVESALLRALTAQREHVAYAFDLPEGAKWSASPADDGSRPVQAGSSFWGSVDPAGSVTPAPARPAGTVSVVADARRPFYAVVEAALPHPVDLSGAPHLYLPFEGSGSGLRYDFVIEFVGGGEAHFLFVDDAPNARLIPFSAALPDRSDVPVDWSQVTGFRLAIDTPDEGSRFVVGIPRASTTSQVDVRLPVVASPEARSATIYPIGDPGATVTPLSVPAGREAVRFRLPFSAMSTAGRVLVPSTEPVAPAPPTTVTFRRDSLTTIEYSVDAPEGGTIVLAQAYDPLWQMHDESGETIAPTSVMSLNGFRLSPGRHVGTISYTGQRAADTGLRISFLCLLAIGVASVVTRRSEQHARRSPLGGRTRMLAPVVSVGCVAIAAVIGLHALPGIDDVTEAAIPAQPLTTSSLSWRSADPQHVHVDEPSPGESRIVFSGRRNLYTLAAYRFDDPQDWVGRRWLFVRLHGEGKGSAYRLMVDFDTDAGGSATFITRDVNPGWRIVALDLWHPDQVDGTVDWGRVSSLRLARDSRRGAGSLTIGDVSLTVAHTR